MQYQLDRSRCGQCGSTHKPPRIWPVFTHCPYCGDSLERNSTDKTDEEKETMREKFNWTHEIDEKLRSLIEQGYDVRCISDVLGCRVDQLDNHINRLRRERDPTPPRPRRPAFQGAAETAAVEEPEESCVSMQASTPDPEASAANEAAASDELLGDTEGKHERLDEIEARYVRFIEDLCREKEQLKAEIDKRDAKLAAQLEYMEELERRVDEQERIIKRREATIFRLVDELHGVEL
jgi:hypothetical protein